MSFKRRYLLFYAVVIQLSLAIAIYCSPYLIHHPDFTIGFVACFSLFGLGFLLLAVFNYLSRTARVRYSSKWVFVILAIVLFSLLSAFLVQRYKQSRVVQDKQLQMVSSKKNDLLDAEKNSALMPLWLDIEKQVVTELNDDSTNQLSHVTKNKLIALSYNYQPYKYDYSDSLILRSPERGELLLNLLKLQIDSSSFSDIIKEATFAYAELIDADLTGSDLFGINLNGAHLNKAQLNKANLSKAKLNDASLWAAKLSQANLNGAQVRRADLQWSDLSRSQFSNANLNGVKLNNAYAKGARMSNVMMKQAELVAVNFDSIDLTGADLYQTDLTKSSCVGAKLSSADLISTIWTDANLSGCDFSKSSVRGASFVRSQLLNVSMDSISVKGEDWFEKLIEWQVPQAKEIITSYRMVREGAKPLNFVLRIK